VEIGDASTVRRRNREVCGVIHAGKMVVFSGQVRTILYQYT
jgi:hypothetical protein